MGIFDFLKGGSQPKHTGNVGKFQQVTATDIPQKCKEYAHSMGKTYVSGAMMIMEGNQVKYMFRCKEGKYQALIFDDRVEIFESISTETGPAKRGALVHTIRG